MLAAFDFRILADVNAALNATAFVLILCGLVAIKAGKESAHKGFMLGAAGVSALFLISYLTYHSTCEAVAFGGAGTIRSVYYVVLASHVILAALVPILVVVTIVYGLQDKRSRHRTWARITAPIWVYVSVTGVLVYYMLYHMEP